ncbi:MAG TPA: hypothetical protein VF636_11895 [Sphingomonas sp.]|jgi:hypothetical protein
MALYPGRGVMAVTGAVPFSPSDHDAICHIEISTERPAGNILFQAAGCEIRSIHDTRLRMFVPPDNVERASESEREFLAAECFYRLALVLEGFSNGFRAPAFGRFPDNAYFIGKRSYVGENVTPLVRHLLMRCPNATDHYHKKTLERYVLRSCA